jgi:hypothetical protein
MPGVTPLRELCGDVGQPFADEADRTRGRCEAGREICALLARVDHRHGEVSVHGPHAAAEQARTTDRLTDDGGREAVPDGVRHNGPTLFLLEPHVRPRRVGVTPRQILRIAHDVVCVVLHRMAVRERLDDRGLAQRTPSSLAEPFGPHPDSQRGDVLPADPADQNRARHRVRETERPRSAGVGGDPFVVQLECREDPAATRGRRRHGVDRKRSEPLAHAKRRHRTRAERGAVFVARLIEDARPGRVPVEPPVELGLRHRLAVGLGHQR